MLVEPIDASRIACGMTWDSREVRPGDVFVALPGQRANGHAFVADALRAGATAVLVSDALEGSVKVLAKEMGAAVIEVSSTAAAITDLAREWRKALRGKVIGVTGSSGKTTTKNLVRDVLATTFSVVATEGNQNNELGAPRTILAADPETEAIIVEMGMRGPGQIADLCGFVRPWAGIVTNVGEGHIELLGSRDNIARAKAELLQALPDRCGLAFLNRSDEYAPFMRDFACLVQRQVGLVWYDGSQLGSPSAAAEQGLAEASAGASCSGVPDAFGPAERQGAWAEAPTLDDQGRPCFILHIGQEQRECRLPLRGAHNVQNALAAASVGASMGVGIDAIVSALEHARPECGRQELVTTREGIVIIDDSYNANPDSLRAALMMLSSYQAAGKRVAVLGDMGELGDFTEACHRGIGLLVPGLSIDRLVCIGQATRHLAGAAVEAGFKAEDLRVVDSVAEALFELEGMVGKGDVVLVKASRFMGLERVVQGMVN
jgi:UDP-N-acetylmuramoyl-tripeptide--D-alanyl-D-alanine ligase